MSFAFCISGTDKCVGVSPGDTVPRTTKRLQIKSSYKNDLKNTSQFKIHWEFSDMFTINTLTNDELYMGVDSRNRPIISNREHVWEIRNGSLMYQEQCLTVSGCHVQPNGYCHRDIFYSVDAVEDIKFGSYLFLRQCGSETFQSFDVMSVGSEAPTGQLPTTSPSGVPSGVPSELPSVFPSGFPSELPGVMPTVMPEVTPSVFVSPMPSQMPSVGAPFSSVVDNSEGIPPLLYVTIVCLIFAFLWILTFFKRR